MGLASENARLFPYRFGFFRSEMDYRVHLGERVNI